MEWNEFIASVRHLETTIFHCIALYALVKTHRVIIEIFWELKSIRKSIDSLNLWAIGKDARDESRRDLHGKKD